MDIDYGALFGIDVGGNEQEAAAPAADQEQAQGEKETETAEPSEHQEQENNDSPPAPDPKTAGGEGEVGDEPPGTEEPKGQTAEQNAQFAAARRKAEAERDTAVRQAIQNEQARHKAEMDAFFAAANLKNTITGAPITNMEEFNSWKAAFEATKLQRDLQAGKLTPEGLNKVISETPVIKKAEEIIRQSEDAARRAREQQARLKVDEQLREISKLDPSIRSLQDLAQMENYDVFYELVKRNNSLLDAFKLANYDALVQKAVASSRQAAVNSVQSKRHLSQTTARGTGAVSVPADVMEQYRAFNPDATEAEIQAHYNRNHKK